MPYCVQELRCELRIWRLVREDEIVSLSQEDEVGAVVEASDIFSKSKRHSQEVLANCNVRKLSYGIVVLQKGDHVLP